MEICQRLRQLLKVEFLFKFCVLISVLPNTKVTSWFVLRNMAMDLSPKHTWPTPTSSGPVGSSSTSSTELSRGAWNVLEHFLFYAAHPRNHQDLVKKAMNYISNRTSCVTFVPSTTTSPNFVTIAPGHECMLPYPEISGSFHVVGGLNFSWE